MKHKNEIHQQWARAQTVKEWMRNISWFLLLVIMFSPRVIDIKISKKTHLLHFLLMTPKNLSQFWKITMDYTELPQSRCQSLKIQDCCIDFGISVFLYITTINTRTLSPTRSTNILKNLKNIFKVHLNILSRLWLIFCCHQQKILKILKMPFDILMTILHNSGRRHDKNDSIFLINSLESIRWYISFFPFISLIPCSSFLVLCSGL